MTSSHYRNKFENMQIYLFKTICCGVYATACCNGIYATLVLFFCYNGSWRDDNEVSYRKFFFYRDFFIF